MIGGIFKSYQSKKIYLKSYNKVFDACHMALLGNNFIGSNGHCLLARTGFFSYLFGYVIKLDLRKLPGSKIEVVIDSKGGYLKLFGHPEKIVEGVFNNIDGCLKT